MLASPLLQFDQWLKDYKDIDPQADIPMVLSTVDSTGAPDSRVVLLKAFEAGKFIFYTNYQSRKGQQLEQCQNVALNIYWPTLERQVRIRGTAEKTSRLQSETYFASRPLLSQISAMISPQSQLIHSHAELMQKFETAAHKAQPICQKHWGGYAVTPYEVEFWQSCVHRLHSRTQYYLHQGDWLQQQLAP